MKFEIELSEDDFKDMQKNNNNYAEPPDIIWQNLPSPVPD